MDLRSNLFPINIEIHQSPPRIPIQQVESSKEDPVEELDGDIDYEEKFSKVFDIAALRVPTKDCFALENRLRGHLLNWPRIRNVARVAGDEIDDEVRDLIENGGNWNQSEEGSEESDATGSLVLYRDELVRKFNSQGYVNFRNLAKISRPPPKRKRNERKWDAKKKEERKESCELEVLGEDADEEMRGLLGGEFRGKGKWIGSTRLLLLDECYAHKGVEELPGAVQAVIIEGDGVDKTLNIELVRCRLTLLYDYWGMDEILEALLPDGMIIPSAFETVGHIAHLNLLDEHLPYRKIIAKVILDKNPKIQTVVNKIDAISNEYRTMQLEVLAGNHSLLTTVVENGVRFNVDLAKVYWSSRLGTERQRLLNGFNRSDVICDVFAGVGPVAVSAAKIVKRVYANDLNPHAVDFLERNSVLNKLEKKIEVFNMDGRRFIHAMFSSEKARSITQVVMNLPKDAAEFLDAFRGIYRDRNKNSELNLPRIHVYGFSNARDPEFDFHERIRIALQEAAVNVDIRRVRQVAPGKLMLCASFILPESVAFAKTTYDM